MAVTSWESDRREGYGSFLLALLEEPYSESNVYSTQSVPK